MYPELLINTNFWVANHVSELISVGDMTVLISHTPNFGDQNFVATHEFGSNFLAGGLEKVYPGFYERPDGPLPESAE